MESVRFKIVVVILMFWLAGCKSDGIESPIQEAAVDPTSQTQINLPSFDSTKDQEDNFGTDEDAQNTVVKTGTPTLPVDTPVPTQVFTNTASVTPLHQPPLTLTVTSTMAITQTQAVSETVVIREAERLTSTWIISDITVTRNGEINQVAWNQDGSIFAAATSLGLYIYDAVTLEPRHTYNVGEGVRTVAFSPNGALLAFGQLNGGIQWRDSETGEYLSTFDAHLLGVSDLSYPVLSQYLVSGSDDGTVSVWLPSALLVPGTTVFVPTNIWRTADRVTCVAINPFFQLVAAGSYKTLSVWNLGTGKPALTIDEIEGWVNDVAFDPGAGVMAVADSSNHLRLWNTSNWVLTHHLQLDELDLITSLGFSPNGNRLAIGSNNGRVLVWDLNSNTVFDPNNVYYQAVTDVAFHPFSGMLMSGYKDGTLRFWTSQP